MRTRVSIHYWNMATGFLMMQLLTCLPVEPFNGVTVALQSKVISVKWYHRILNPQLFVRLLLTICTNYPCSDGSAYNFSSAQTLSSSILYGSIGSATEDNSGLMSIIRKERFEDLAVGTLTSRGCPIETFRWHDPSRRRLWDKQPHLFLRLPHHMSLSPHPTHLPHPRLQSATCNENESHSLSLVWHNFGL